VRKQRRLVKATRTKVPSTSGRIAFSMERSYAGVPQTPFAIDGIDHVLVIVEGMLGALTFYEGVLGCIVETRLPQYGMVELRAGGSHIDLVDASAPEGSWAKPAVAGGRNVHHVALRLRQSGEKALREYLEARGVSIDEERIEDDGTVSFYVTDPSGNTIELIAAKESSAAV
jgi:catechol 2,3-dioxygenase-like lactoylglutathione lyase family enzyme